MFSCGYTAHKFKNTDYYYYYYLAGVTGMFPGLHPMAMMSTLAANNPTTHPSLHPRSNAIAALQAHSIVSPVSPAAGGPNPSIPYPLFPPTNQQQPQVST